MQKTILVLIVLVVVTLIAPGTVGDESTNDGPCVKTSTDPPSAYIDPRCVESETGNTTEDAPDS